MTRPIRFCPACQQADDSLRHAIYGMDPNVALHMSCCAAQGCPDGSCPIVLQGAEGLEGEALVEHIRNPSEEIQAALDARDEATRHFTLADVNENAAPIVLTQE